MRLRVGQAAPSFVARDVYGRRVSLADYFGSKVLLMFARSASCPLCSVRVWHLIRRYPEYQRQGMNIVAFFESSPEQSYEYLDRLRCPFPLIPDLQRQVYNLYGLETSYVGTALPLLRRIPVYNEARKRKLAIWNPFLNILHHEGAKMRMPADFLVGPDLRIRRAYYAKDAGDFMLFSELDTFAAARL